VFWELSTGVFRITISSCHWAREDVSQHRKAGTVELTHSEASYDLKGWAKIHLIVRLFTLSQKDTTWTDDYPNTGAWKEVLALPNRRGGRPVIKGIAPQRQFDQLAPLEMNDVSIRPNF
jgi:hypothetical protein